MKQIEVVARSQAQAIEKAAAKLAAPVERLEVIEEYSPDEQDLATLAEEEKAGPVADGEPVLYMVRVGFRHYVDRSREWVAGLMAHFNPEIAVDAAVIGGGQILVRIQAPDPSILIGKQGQTLDALQHVVARAVAGNDDDFPEILLDAGGFREKRLHRLEDEAHRAAERALRIRKPVALPAMSAPERKFIHNLLKETLGVSTISSGKEPNRHIVVEPNNARGGGGNRADGNRAEGNRADGNRADGNRADGNRSDGNRQGGNRHDGNRRDSYGGGQGRGHANPVGKPKKAPMSSRPEIDYAGLPKDEDDDFVDTPLEGATSRLPQYREDLVDSETLNPNRKFVDELE